MLEAADRLLEGEWEALGVVRTDMEQPRLVPRPGDRPAVRSGPLRLPRRSPLGGAGRQRQAGLGTLPAAAPHVAGQPPGASAGDDRYARRVAEQLRSWWQENPFLSGIHWTSGIELGVRLISLAWIRRLLDDWPGVADLFERNGLAVRQIRWHQQYLAAFRSRGSSANNHVIAEAAGQLVASCAFPWFPESERWRRDVRAAAGARAAAQHVPVGHQPRAGLRLPLLRRRTRVPRRRRGRGERPSAGPPAWQRLAAMADSAAALLDERLRPPRQGDSDEGRALLLDAPAPNRWPSLLALADALVGRLDWWPRPPAGRGQRRSSARCCAPAPVRAGPAQRPSRFADAGMTLLRTTGENEIWCRCDGGPHGYLSIAAHAHADALSVEVRYAGVDILADPGTYCYHGEPAWRSYFRSTIAHNTAELGGRSQSSEGGPFMWVRHAQAREIEVIDDGDIARWTAEHRRLCLA